LNKTYIIPIPDKKQQLAKRLSRFSGRIYSKVVSTIFKLNKRKNIWLSKNNMEKLIRLYAEDFPLHSQSKQGIVQQYYYNLKSYFKSIGNHQNPKPPYKTRKYNKVIFKKSAIKLKKGTLTLKNGRKGQSLNINIPGLTKKPKYAEIIYNHYQRKYRVHIVVELSNKKIEYDNNKVLSIDVGQIHPMTTFDGKQVIIFNGGKLNSFIRFRNLKLFLYGLFRWGVPPVE